MVNIEMTQKRQMVEETTLLDEIRWNRMKEPKVIKKLEKEDGQSWEEKGIIYVDERIYMPNNQKLQ